MADLRRWDSDGRKSRPQSRRQIGFPSLRRALLCGTLLLALSAAPASAADIDACKYLMVADLAEDTYSLARQLREQGAAQGFTMVTSQVEVPPEDAFKSCVIVGSWLGDIELGQLA